MFSLTERRQNKLEKYPDLEHKACRWQARIWYVITSQKRVSGITDEFYPIYVSVKVG